MEGKIWRAGNNRADVEAYLRRVSAGLSFLLMHTGLIFQFRSVTCRRKLPASPLRSQIRAH